MPEATCPIDGCNDVFVNQTAHNLHLEKIHKISVDSERFKNLQITHAKRKAAGEIVKRSYKRAFSSGEKGGRGVEKCKE